VSVKQSVLNPKLALLVADLEGREGVDKTLRYLSLTAQPVPKDFFFKTKETRAYILEKSPSFAQKFSSDVQRRLFVEVGEGSGKGDIAEAIAARRKKKEIREESGLSKQEFREIFREQRKQTEKEIGQQIFKDIGSFKELVAVAAEPYRTKEGIFREIKEGVKENIPIFGEPIRLVETGASIALIKDKKKEVFVYGGDVDSAKRGAGMVAYTGASLLQNVPAFGSKAPEVAQTIDVGLATGTYTQALVYPTPMNVGAAKIEIYDVAVDFVPEVAGALWMGATGLAGGIQGGVRGLGKGYQVGRRIPTPNINTNVAINQQAQAFVSEVPLPAGSSDFSFVSELPVQYDFEGYSTVVKGGAAVAEDVAVRTPRVNLNFSEEIGLPTSNVNAFESAEVNINENINQNVNQNINENINQNALINENINQNVNQNVNAFINENMNINANLNLNENVNFNVNFLGFPDRRESDGRLFQAFAKVGGEFKPVGGATSLRGAARQGFSFVDRTPSRTFAVKEVGQEGFVNLDFGKGFKKKETSKGFFFVEPSKKAIDTFGELQGITKKGILASKSKRRRLL